MSITTDPNFERDYDREMFRSSVFSAMWGVFSTRKADGFKLADLAAALGKDKGYISRLFSNRENCKLNTVSDLAYALDADIRFEIVDRRTGVRYGAAGPVRTHAGLHPEPVKKVHRMGSGMPKPMRTVVTR